MLPPRKCLIVSCLFGMVITATGCGQEVERAAQQPGVHAQRSGPARAKPLVRSTTTTQPDVRGALTAVKHVTDVLFATTTTQAPPPTYRLIPPVRADNPSSVNGYPCGGDLPPCYVLHRESRGNPTIVEGGGSPYSHASGLWQFMPRTWNNYAGYPYAAAAPWQVQNEKARLTYAEGAGCSHWSACG